MKKEFFIGLLFGASLVSVFAFENKANNQPPSKGNISGIKGQIRKDIDVRKYTNDLQVCSDYSNKQPNQMDKNFVLSMIRNYYNKQYAAINGSSTLIPFPQSSGLTVDSRCVFFSLDTLKKLLYYIEKSSKNFLPGVKSNVGVNVYFASYPDFSSTRINGQDYTNRHTLVFLPAVFTGNGANALVKDYDMLDNLKFPLKTDPSYFTTTLLSSSTFLKMGGIVARSENMNAQNHGTGTPPPFGINGTGNPILDITDPY
ncbi:MAG: hypothetical protein ACOVO1_10275 [Chitinophagaceae bacterium]